MVRRLYLSALRVRSNSKFERDAGPFLFACHFLCPSCVAVLLPALSEHYSILDSPFVAARHQVTLIASPRPPQDRPGDAQPGGKSLESRVRYGPPRMFGGLPSSLVVSLSLPAPSLRGYDGGSRGARRDRRYPSSLLVRSRSRVLPTPASVSFWKPAPCFYPSSLALLGLHRVADRTPCMMPTKPIGRRYLTVHPPCWRVLHTERAVHSTTCATHFASDHGRRSVFLALFLRFHVSGAFFRIHRPPSLAGHCASEHSSPVVSSCTQRRPSLNLLRRALRPTISCRLGMTETTSLEGSEDGMERCLWWGALRARGGATRSVPLSSRFIFARSSDCFSLYLFIFLRSSLFLFTACAVRRAESRRARRAWCRTFPLFCLSESSRFSIGSRAENASALGVSAA